jgi:hypothetical protein
MGCSSLVWLASEEIKRQERRGEGGWVVAVVQGIILEKIRA